MSSSSNKRIIDFFAALEALKKAAAYLSTNDVKLSLQAVGGLDFLTSNPPKMNGIASRAEEPERRRREQLDYAEEALRPVPKGMHYMDIARQALKNGCKYRGKSYSDGEIPEEVLRGFGHSLNGSINKSDKFDNLGRGFFNLKEHANQ